MGQQQLMKVVCDSKQRDTPRIGLCDASITEHLFYVKYCFSGASGIYQRYVLHRATKQAIILTSLREDPTRPLP